MPIWLYKQDVYYRIFNNNVVYKLQSKVKLNFYYLLCTNFNSLQNIILIAIIIQIVFIMGWLVYFLLKNFISTNFVIKAELTSLID